MSGVYLTDEVEITPVTRDANFRNESEGTPYSSKAYVEEDDKITYNADGTPIKPARKIFLPHNILISEGDYIRVTKLSFQSVTERREKVKAANPVGGFRPNYIRVIV